MMINNKARAKFETHLNYIKHLSLLLHSERLETKLKLKKLELPLLDTKRNLINLTIRSLKEEMKIVEIDDDYAYASIVWLPIKAYYLLFNELLTIQYLINPTKESFNLSHSKNLSFFTEQLSSGKIFFTNPMLNKVLDRRIFNYKIQTGSNLSQTINPKLFYFSAMKKIADYKLQEWRRSKNLDFRTKEGRQEKEKYLNKFTISIFEFPYYMRIRANYRDFTFIEDIPPEDTKNYFCEYYNFTVSLFNSLRILEKSFLEMRS